MVYIYGMQRRADMITETSYTLTYIHFKSSSFCNKDVINSDTLSEEKNLL